jgi:hypothetical protein
MGSVAALPPFEIAHQVGDRPDVPNRKVPQSLADRGTSPERAKGLEPSTFSLGSVPKRVSSYTERKALKRFRSTTTIANYCIDTRETQANVFDYRP